MNTDGNEVLLVGAGQMALHYTRVLSALGIRPIVFGRGKESASAFEREAGIAPTTGCLERQISESVYIPRTAIVAVNAEQLAHVTTKLAQAGVRRLLVEKPAALDVAEMNDLQSAISSTQAQVFLAYNRRFLSSVLEAERFVREDGGVLSVKADFSEPARRIATLNKPQRELDTWFYGNSSHVVDLAFHFFGAPVSMSGDVRGEVDWHRAAGAFAGHACNADGALMTWHANWMSPGRWGLEVMTREHRLILQPLEKLRIQKHDSFQEFDVDVDDTLDRDFKPGLMRQIRAFLFGEDEQRLPTLEEHAEYMPFYEKIRVGGD